MEDYFLKFEDRRPEPPLPYSAARELLWQLLATAETCAYVGLIQFVFNLWKDDPIGIQTPPRVLQDITPGHPDGDRILSVDVMFATYNEEPELVRLGLRDAKRITYPHEIAIRIHVLDGGRRPEMRKVAEDEGVNYITRSSNEGFKAGNLRHAVDHISGDLLVICDADTRPFPSILENTLGYFSDPKMAWVQTPQWFYDLPEGEALDTVLARRFGARGATTEILTPYKFHVSEDIYTSIMMHSDRARGWKSKMHPIVESKMLSPQDLLTWTVQRYKYAGGSLDILVNDNPLFRRGLTFSQRMMYATTFFSYLAPIWNLIFLLAPIVYLFSGISPVSAYSADFFWHLIPFLVALELAMMVGTWGVPGYAAKTSFLSFFPLGL